jgi:hypothetical protein
MGASKAYFMVRAQVPNESERTKFDQRYRTHHLPLTPFSVKANRVVAEELTRKSNVVSTVSCTGSTSGIGPTLRQQHPPGTEAVWG